MNPSILFNVFLRDFRKQKKRMILTLVAILWGRDAQTLVPMLRKHDVPVLTSAHPSPLSAHRGFFGSRPFSRANALLAEMGAEPIDWRLP